MAPSPIWHEETIVKTYETDINQRWKPACFFQAMQEAAAHHAAHLGFDFPEMMAHDMVWILSRMKVVFYRFPTLQEKVFIETWPKGIQQKLFFMRDFHLTAADGSRLASASSAWLLVNPKARRLLMPNSLYGPFPDNGGRYAIQEAVDKLAAPENLPVIFTADTRYSAIDLMAHTNNARYVEWICDCFPIEDWQNKHLIAIQVNYVNEVRPGEAVALGKGATEEQGTWHVTGTNQSTGQRAFEALISWK